MGEPDRYGAARSPEANELTDRAQFWHWLDIAGGRRRDKKNMSDGIVPHFHNTPGVAVIEIGAHEFMCEGELAPFDHPHVYLDMGDATEIICPYCSTLFRYDPTLDPNAARPAECALSHEATA
jgi:uncharacterized Zn-finger protein